MQLDNETAIMVWAALDHYQRYLEDEGYFKTSGAYYALKCNVREFIEKNTNDVSKKGSDGPKDR